jgi:hypothetical protein
VKTSFFLLAFRCLMPKGEKKFYLASVCLSVCFSNCNLRLSVFYLNLYLITHGLYDLNVSLMLYELLCLMSIHVYAYYAYCYVFISLSFMDDAWQ